MLENIYSNHCLFFPYHMWLNFPNKKPLQLLQRNVNNIAVKVYLNSLKNFSSIFCWIYFFAEFTFSVELRNPKKSINNSDLGTLSLRQLGESFKTTR